ncbi:MAG: MCE family protein [Aeromicrobium erythreum]
MRDLVPTRRRTWLVAALLAALVAGCAVVPGLGSGDRTVTVELRDAAGLFQGNDVGVLGVRVGEVESIRPVGSHVEVRLRIDDDDVRIPADAGAVVVSRSVATDRYVELTPVYRSGPRLVDGARIPLDRTRNPVEFDTLLRSVTDVSRELSSPDGEKGEGPLGSLLRESARTLDGKGATIRDGLADLSDVLTDVEGGLGDAEGTVRDLDTLTEAIADDRDLVQDFTRQVAAASSMLDDQKEAVGAALAALTRMVQAVARFVRDHQGQVSNQLDDFVSLARGINRNQGDLERLLDNAPLMLQNLIRAIDENDRLSFRTRPVSLVPGEEVARTVCKQAKVPEELCGRFGALPIFDLLRYLSGVRDR